MYEFRVKTLLSSRIPCLRFKIRADHSKQQAGPPTLIHKAKIRASLDRGPTTGPVDDIPAEIGSGLIAALVVVD